MLKIFVFALLLILSAEIFGADVVFMKTNHPDHGHEIHYSLASSNCQISPSSPIKVEVYDVKQKSSRAARILEKVYFGIDHQEVGQGRFSFYLNSLKNLRFDVEAKRVGKKCIFDKTVTFEEITYPIEFIRTHYHHRLAFPTLNYVEFFASAPTPILIIENYQARGYFPFYEFKLGAAMNIHTNIRPRDKRLFHRQNPIYEPRPAFMVRYGPLFLNNDGLGSLLLPLEHFTLLAAFILEGEPYEAQNLRDRRQSIYFGPLIKSHFLEVHYYREIMEQHRGEVLKISLAPEFAVLSNFTVNPRVFYQLWDNRYVDYYFGVNRAEAQHFGGPYKGQQTENYGFSVQNTLKYKKFEYFASIGMKFYGKSVKDSPLTIKDYEYQLFTGFLYNFF